MRSSLLGMSRVGSMRSNDVRFHSWMQIHVRLYNNVEAFQDSSKHRTAVSTLEFHMWRVRALYMCLLILSKI